MSCFMHPYPQRPHTLLEHAVQETPDVDDGHGREFVHGVEEMWDVEEEEEEVKS